MQEALHRAGLLTSTFTSHSLASHPSLFCCQLYVQVDALGSLLLGGRALINLLPLTYQNAVEKNAWLAAVVTSDCQHVVGASANNNAHKLFFWEKGSGNLVRMLEGE